MAITDYDANKDLNVRIDGVQIDVGDSWELSFAIRTIMADLAGSTLDALAGLATTDGNIIVGNGSTWVAESGATARTSLGLGTGDNPTFAEITLSDTGNVIPVWTSTDSNAVQLRLRTDGENRRIVGDTVAAVVKTQVILQDDEIVFGGTTVPGANEWMRIDATGLGIGTAAPGFSLDVSDTATITARVASTSTSQASLVITNTSQDAGALSRIGFLHEGTDNVASAAAIIDAGVDQQWTATASTRDGFMRFIVREDNSATEKMRITSAGNVGIGITAPDVELDVAGAIGITDGVTAPSTVSGKAFIYVDTADGDLKVKFGDGTVKTLATDT